MMQAAVAGSNLELDEHVDDEIAECLSLSEPISFFLFAGAGSGKTRSLEHALSRIREKYGDELRLRARGAAVITYTNAAVEEIMRRIELDPLFHVSTIHSFAWHLIGGLNHDIREWVRAHLAQEIAELEEAERKGRRGTQASRARQADIASKGRRLARLDEIKTFVYNPNGDNKEKNSLSHSEVIRLSSHFLSQKRVMQRILVSKYPFLLVDESQDTNKALVDAILAVEASHRGKFCVGFFGDMMQRIYGDGKERFEEAVPAEWRKPSKQLNHRCPKRIVRLINRIRSAVDDQVQQPRCDAAEGFARLFILPADTADKPGAEAVIRGLMARIASDDVWAERDQCKMLVLEHHMAARRMGFENVFGPLYEVPDFRTGVQDGSFPPLRLFTDCVLPLVRADRANDRFAVAKVVREQSPLLTSAALAAADSPKAQLALAKEAVEDLMRVWKTADSRCADVLRVVAAKGLFEIPERLRPLVDISLAGLTAELAGNDDDSDDGAKELLAVARFLEAPASEIEKYAAYVGDGAAFGTHQGVKGLEFDRVMVIMDDTDAKGFLFGYEKLFGAKALTATDLKNQREGKETGIDRTRRLFYVTCSRAKRSLALVAYTSDPEAVKAHVLRNGWFEEDEVILSLDS